MDRQSCEFFKEAMGAKQAYDTLAKERFLERAFAKDYQTSAEMAKRKTEEVGERMNLRRDVSFKFLSADDGSRTA